MESKNDFFVAEKGRPASTGLVLLTATNRGGTGSASFKLAARIEAAACTWLAVKDVKVSSFREFF